MIRLITASKTNRRSRSDSSTVQPTKTVSIPSTEQHFNHRNLALKPALKTPGRKLSPETIGPEGGPIHTLRSIHFCLRATHDSV